MGTQESGVTMAKTCAQMIDRVLELAGRKHTTSLLPLSSIILDALNEAQRKIAQRIPAALALEVKDETTFDAVTNQSECDLATLNPPVSHIHRVFLLDGLSSQEILFKPRDWFDRNFPVVSALTAGFPAYWTRRSNTLVFSCPWESNYNGKALRIDYAKKPTVFTSTTSTQTCDFEDADDGLILWGQVQALRAIGKASPAAMQTALDCERRWNQWLIDYEADQDLETEANPDDYPQSILYEDWGI